MVSGLSLNKGSVAAAYTITHMTPVMPKYLLKSEFPTVFLACYRSSLACLK